MTDKDEALKALLKETLKELLEDIKTEKRQGKKTPKQAEKDYSDEYDKFFERLLDPDDPLVWESMYLSPYDRQRAEAYLCDGSGYMLCTKGDLKSHADIQSRVESDILELWRFKRCHEKERVTVPLHEVACSERGKRFIWIKFLHSYVDLETGEGFCVSLKREWDKYQ